MLGQHEGRWKSQYIRDFAWSEEKRLTKAVFEKARFFPGFNATFGIAPVLLTCLAVLGVSPVAIERRAGTNVVTISGSDGKKITYAARYLGVATLQDDLTFIDELLAARRSPASSSRSMPCFIASVISPWPISSPVNSPFW
jgi:hypothetical protein